MLSIQVVESKDEPGKFDVLFRRNPQQATVITLDLQELRKLDEAIANLADSNHCGYRVWPFTENNICSLKPGHADDHEDAKGRKFDVAGYIKRSP